MKLMKVKDVRKCTHTPESFSREMAISIADATAVLNYVAQPNVQDDNLVILEETVIDGYKIGAGNVSLS